MGLQATFEYSAPINDSFMDDKSSKLIMTAHISQFTLWTIAGHSNTDVGSVHGATREADITQDKRNMVANYLTQTGVQIRIDGTGKGNLPLREAVKLIKGTRWPVSFIAMLLPISLQKGVEPLAHSRDKAIAKTLQGSFKRDEQSIAQRGWVEAWELRPCLCANGGTIY